VHRWRPKSAGMAPATHAAPTAAARAVLRPSGTGGSSRSQKPAGEGGMAMRVKAVAAREPAP